MYNSLVVWYSHHDIPNHEKGTQYVRAYNNFIFFIKRAKRKGNYIFPTSLCLISPLEQKEKWINSRELESNKKIFYEVLWDKALGS